MKWRGRRGSQNIEDRRRRGGGGGGGGARIGGLGAVVVVLLGLFFGVDTSFLVGQNGPVASSSGSGEVTPEDDQAAQFVSVALRDTETIWAELFRTQVGREYRPATLVLFKGATQSPCGGANGASGPFYCPADRKAYLDTDFFVTMARQMGAGGDFAAAYVVAHEVAHHVQNELGILGQANQLRARVSQRESNEISVRLELQADCYSGIWARLAQDKLGTVEPGDLGEALNAAKQVGDDTIMLNAGKRPNPHTFTHGTSAQRQRWFARGYEAARMDACDTFGTNQL
ncbi:MAG: neutral zinc metallopeptidase [Pseudomonadota bacterium]